MTVPVWRNPRADQGNPRRDHLTPPCDAQTTRRSERMVATLFTAAALAGAAFVVSYAAIPNDASTLAMPMGSIRALNCALGLTLSVALSCLGAGFRRWARIRMSRTAAAPPFPQRTDEGCLEAPGDFEEPVVPEFRERA
ncbi:hypothetical protein [Streptomyces sp. NPDC088254]|uniref:hypothetical protein n=1 Tax=Streptomyces sp. NPDC088254 TaxID=3365847 RepID=UPI00380309A7